jgi:hypothetical protein
VEVGEEAEEAGEMPEIKMEHKEELMKMAAVLKEVSLKEMNDINTNEMVFEFHKAMREKDNPLRQELPLDINKNFFVEVLKYGLTRTEKLVQFILKLTMTHERLFDESTVVTAGKIYTIIAANINPDINNVYRKKVGVFLQSCGLRCSDEYSLNDQYNLCPQEMPGMWLILGPRSGVLQWVGGAVPLFRLYKPQQGRLRAHLATVRLRLPGRGEEWPSTEDSAKHCYTRGDLGYTFRALETVVVAVQAKEGAGALLGPGDRPVCLRETWFYGEQGGLGEALFLVEATRRTGGAVLNTGRLQQVEVAVQAVVVVGRRSEQEAREEEDRR